MRTLVTLAVAVGAGQIATLAGVSLAYGFDVAAGGAIVLVAIGVYATATVGGRYWPRRAPTASGEDRRQ